MSQPPSAARPHLATHTTRVREPARRRRSPRPGPGEPPRPRGRPRKDGSPPVQRRPVEERRPERPEPPAHDAGSPAPAGWEERLVRWLLEPDGPPPAPETPAELGVMVAHLAGIGVPIPIIAAGLGIELEDLKDGGRPLDEVFAEMLRRRTEPETLSKTAARGKLWTVARVCHKAFEVSLVASGSPLPRIQWLNEQAQWRRSGPRDLDAEGGELREIRMVFVDERQSARAREEEPTDARSEGAAVGKAAAGEGEV